ncbi:uncharacterized protein LOC127812729 [Diospyros lotus]|uniref:uncharacterized protein LOC127812729 n=1 Tax=Diospyros lotus TaxID=55363 RepID=UPI00225C3D39|nr:uncharacterized protein LOC127812729 [Diospyros lotus]
MKAYVDDMIVKSRQGESHASQLEKVFAIFRKNNMRLNPDKCTFGVKSGKFLGYMITHRGIEANLEKVQAVIDMQPPSSVREVQRLNGRLTALGRFLSKQAKRSLPFCKALKGGKSFQWTPECEKDFQELKAYLKKIPLLTRSGSRRKIMPIPGISHQAVSVVLVRQLGQIDSLFQGTFEAREPLLARYLQKVKELAPTFECFELIQINRSLNHHADALSKLASAQDTSRRLIHMEVLQRPSVETSEEGVHCIDVVDDWRTLILKYLLNQELSAAPSEAKRMKTKAARFAVIGQELYKRGYSVPLIKCLGTREANQALEEVHEETAVSISVPERWLGKSYE